jgi:hypothetical protein
VLQNPSGFVRDFRFQARFLGEGYSVADLGRSHDGWIVYAREFPLWGNGLPFALAVAAGIAWALVRLVRRRDRSAALLLAAALPGYLYLGSGIFVRQRFLLIVTPFLLLLGAWVVDEAVGAALRLARRRAPQWRVAALLVVGALLLAPHGLGTVRWSRNKFGSDPRAELLAWMYANLDRDRPYFDLCFPAMYRFFVPGKGAIVTRAGDVETDEQRAILKLHQERWYRSTPLLRLVRENPDVDALKAALVTAPERRLIVCASRAPGRVKPRAALRQALKLVPKRGSHARGVFDDWDRVAELLGGLEILGHARAGQANLWVLELPESL